MAGVWKRDGTVAVTNGSKKVTGTGTTFADAKNGVAKGHLFCMTTGTTVDLYEVDYVVSNTELHLVQAFRGTTGTGKAYEIITTFSDSIPEFARKLNASLSYYQSQSDMVQQLFTSDAAEITVTAPDGTTHKLIPWKRVTSEGEGQAARAKVEADKAAAAAALATDVVRDSAMPLPDVWSPLVDSLRLVTGKGKEIKVGDDVVARRWEFERLSAATERQKDGKLRLVPAGEPRYEGGALVKERGSTNLYFPHDGSSGCSAVRGSVVTSAGSGLLGETSTVKYVEDSTNGSHYLWGKTLSGFNVGDEVSISVELVPLKAGLTAIQLGCNTFTDVKANLNLLPSDIGKPIIITHKSTVTGTTVQPYVWPILGGNQNWQGDGSTVFELLSIQVEKGSPTSLIPTTTAAATRAAESVWLPGPANSAGYGKSRTYAFEFEIISPSTSGYVPFICEGAYPTRTLITVWNDGNLQANNDYVRATMSSPVFKKRNVISATFDYDGGYVMLSLNGSPVVKSPVVCTVKPGQAEIAYEKLEIGALGGGGHQSSIRIRNFRQWNRPSSEAQLRAIK
ncbi:phage head spike fiber domain-containing protein [Aeromonas sp. 604534]|uniref:phage head spike fiber domain-containing protein n=1 Tax=Aeromonas sp. 604534 TaxID=2712055 RepID=UPI003B9FB4AA